MKKMKRKILQIKIRVRHTLKILMKIVVSQVSNKIVNQIYKPTQMKNPKSNHHLVNILNQKVIK